MNGTITGLKAKPIGACEVDMKVGDLVETAWGNKAIILEVFPKRENQFIQRCKIWYLKTGATYDGYRTKHLRVLNESR